MSIAKILVPLDGAAQDTIAATIAIRAAKPFNAHVSAVFARPDPCRSAAPAWRAADGRSDAGHHRRTNRVCGVRGKDSARNIAPRLHRAKASSSWITPSGEEAVTCSFRERPGHAAKVIAELASLSDLVVFGRSARLPQSYETILDVLLKAQRPVLHATEVPDRLFHRVAIGWDGGACAAHAMFAAMPYLRRAQSVEVVTIDRGQATRPP
jgi:hypothetical protein